MDYFLLGLVAAILLIGGGLSALQTASISTGLPFVLILLLMCYSLRQGLSREYKELHQKVKDKEREDYKKLVKETIKHQKENQ